MQAEMGRALLTDLYQLTMSYGYWKLGRAERGAVFHLFFRELPFGGGYAVTAGLQQVLEFIESFRFESSDLVYLRTLQGNDGQRLFSDEFLQYLCELKLTCDVDAIREGTLVFPREPMVRVRGPILQCQLLETALLNLVNFPTLVATKAARICQAADGDAVLEFGLRRAQGVDGGVTASRAAYVGGCEATSNVLAGQRFGIPVRGTHAHSWVMSFPSEQAAFDGYADAMPNNCVFLVDTYDTLEGVRRAADVGRKLKAGGHSMVGIRLDSGDLAQLSIGARQILDAAGLQDAVIVASNDLDEHSITRLKAEGAQISVWGVGTKLATAFDQPALGGVYKLGAQQDDAGQWQPRIKVSEQPIKSTIPGVLQVRRFFAGDQMRGDVIYDELSSLGSEQRAVSIDGTVSDWAADELTSSEDLLVPVVRAGQRVDEREPLVDVRERTLASLARLDPATRQLKQPRAYRVYIDEHLDRLRQNMLAEHSHGDQEAD